MSSCLSICLCVQQLGKSVAKREREREKRERERERKRERKDRNDRMREREREREREEHDSLSISLFIAEEDDSTMDGEEETWKSSRSSDRGRRLVGLVAIVGGLILMTTGLSVERRRAEDAWRETVCVVEETGAETETCSYQSKTCSPPPCHRQIYDTCYVPVWTVSYDGGRRKGRIRDERRVYRSEAGARGVFGTDGPAEGSSTPCYANNAEELVVWQRPRPRFVFDLMIVAVIVAGLCAMWRTVGSVGGGGAAFGRGGGERPYYGGV